MVSIWGFGRAAAAGVEAQPERKRLRHGWRQTPRAAIDCLLPSIHDYGDCCCLAMAG